MERCFMFQWGRGGVVFQIGVGASFLNGEHLMGGIAFGEGGFRKNWKMAGLPPLPPPLPYYGKP